MLPGPTEAPVPWVTPIMLQMPAPLSRVMVRVVELSPVLRLPAASVTSARRVVVDTPSEAIGLTVNVIIVDDELPGLLLGI